MSCNNRREKKSRKRSLLTVMTAAALAVAVTGGTGWRRCGLKAAAAFRSTGPRVAGLERQRHYPNAGWKNDQGRQDAWGERSTPGTTKLTAVTNTAVPDDGKRSMSWSKTQQRVRAELNRLTSTSAQQSENEVVASATMSESGGGILPEIDATIDATTDATTDQIATPPPLPPPPLAVQVSNDTFQLHQVGVALTSSDVAAAELVGASVLAIDPANIEIVPISGSAEAREAERRAAMAAKADDPAKVLEKLEKEDGVGEEDDEYTVVAKNGKVVMASPPVGVIRAERAAAKVSSEFTSPLFGPNFVKMFRGSAPYIANHRNTLVVYHIPGELLQWDGFADLIDDIALTWLLGLKIVLVCGCRYQIDKRMAQRDLEGYDPILHNSIRVTDASTLRVVKEEAGYVRFEVERQLARALRVHGGPRFMEGGEDGNVVSGNFYSAQPFGVINGVDYMYTGFPRRFEVDKIRNVHASNDIVLLTSLGVSPSGEIFNVNSESLAASVAGALSASKVIYFAVRGTALVKKDTDKIVQNLRLSDARSLLQHYRVRMHKRGFASVDNRGMEDIGEGGGEEEEGGGMPEAVRRAHESHAVTENLLKIGWATSALEKGVKRAHIIAPTNGALLQELYTRDGSGTLISRDLYEGIRPADHNDVAGIYDLIDPLVKMGTLVPRPRNLLEKDINSYYVYTRDNLIVATGQLKRFEGGFAEIGCLVVSSEYRSQGRGDAMLGYLERLCLQCGASKIFVLSTQTMEWFVERGFREVGVDALPPSRKAVYNHNRRSKIYMKQIDGDRDLDAAELWWNR